MKCISSQPLDFLEMFLVVKQIETAEGKPAQTIP